MAVPPRSEFFFLATPSKVARFFVLVALGLVLCLLRYKSINNISSAYLGGFEGDAGLYVWLAKHATHSFFELPWFSTLSFYPYGGALAWSDSFLVPGIIFGLFKLITSGDIAAYNLLFITALFLNGYFSFRLLYALTADLLSSIAFGILILSFLPLEAHLGHPQLQFVFFIPLGILHAFKFIQKPTAMRAFGMTVLIPLAFLTTVYYSLFLVVLFTSIFVALICIHPEFVTRKFLAPLATGGILSLIILAPFSYPYLITKEMFGARGLYEAYYFSASTLSLFSAPPISSLYSVLSEVSHSEAHLFGGVVLLVLFVFAIRRVFGTPQLHTQFTIVSFFGLLALTTSSVSMGNQYFKYATALFSWAFLGSCIYGFILLGRLERAYKSSIITNRNVLAMIGFTAFIFLFLSCGPLGNPEKGHLTPGLYGALYYLVPGFDALRAISRSGMIGMYLVALCSFLLISHLRGAGKLSAPVFAALLLTPIIENQTTVYQLDFPLKKPQVISSSNITTSGIAIGLPYAGELDSNGGVKSWTDFARRQVYFMNWFEDAQVASVNGYSGQISKLMKDMPRRLAGFPDDRSVRELASIAGLRKIVYVPALDQHFNALVFEAKLELFKEVLTVEFKDADGNYLISFAPKTALTPDFVLRLPGAGGELSFQVETRGKCTEPKTSLKIKDVDNLKEPSLAEISLTAPKGTYSIKVPSDKSTNGYRPLRIQFETVGCPLIISNALFTP